MGWSDESDRWTDYCASLTWRTTGEPTGTVALSDALLGNLGSCIHVDVTLRRTIYPSIVPHHLHPCMEKVLPDGCGLSQQDNALKTEMVEELFEEHNNQFEELT